MSYRNALLIIADDWDLISRCYNNPFIQTPNIDRFAEKSLTFDFAFCTTPSCAASRASILTGRHSHTHGQLGHCHGKEPFSTHADMLTLPKVCEDAGVFTGIIGKSHVAPMGSVYPFTYEDLGDLYRPDGFGERVSRFFDACGERNFYLHVALGDPHRRGISNGFKNEFEIPDFDQPTYTEDQIIVPDFLPDEPEVRLDLIDYYEAVSRFDHGVGLVLDALKASGREEDTMIIVTNDHGMPFPGAKASSFDTGHHCPFILHTPDLKNKGTHHRAMMSWLDIAPTIYDWCGLTGPDDLPGRSLVPVLDDPDCEGWDEVTFSHTFHEVTNYNPYRVLRGRNYKLVYNCAHQLPTPLPSDLYRSPTWQCVLNKKLPMMGKRPTERFLFRDEIELFDVATDPMETVNLAMKTEYRPVVEDMTNRLLDLCLKTDDPWMEVAFQRGLTSVDAKMLRHKTQPITSV